MKALPFGLSCAAAATALMVMLQGSESHGRIIEAEGFRLVVDNKVLWEVGVVEGGAVTQMRFVDKESGRDAFSVRVGKDSVDISAETSATVASIVLTADVASGTMLANGGLVGHEQNLRLVQGKWEVGRKAVCNGAAMQEVLDEGNMYGRWTKGGGEMECRMSNDGVTVKIDMPGDVAANIRVGSKEDFMEIGGKVIQGLKLLWKRTAGEVRWSSTQSK